MLALAARAGARSREGQCRKECQRRPWKHVQSLNLSSRTEVAEAKKAAGNAAYSAGDYAKAVELYSEAVGTLLFPLWPSLIWRAR